MQQITMTPERWELLRREAIASLIEEGGPASLAGIMWTPGSIELAGVAVQTLAVLLDLGWMVGLAALLAAVLGPIGPWAAGLVWFAAPVFWRLYGRSPGMALFGLYLVHLTRDDAVRPSVLLGVGRLWLQCLTLMLVPFARAAHAVALLRSTWPILPADRLLRVRVFRYRLLPPPGRSRVEKVLDSLGMFRDARLSRTAETSAARPARHA